MLRLTLSTGKITTYYVNGSLLDNGVQVKHFDNVILDDGEELDQLMESTYDGTTDLATHTGFVGVISRGKDIVRKLNYETDNEAIIVKVKNYLIELGEQPEITETEFIQSKLNSTKNTDGKKTRRSKEQVRQDVIKAILDGTIEQVPAQRGDKLIWKAKNPDGTYRNLSAIELEFVKTKEELQSELDARFANEMLGTIEQVTE